MIRFCCIAIWLAKCKDATSKFYENQFSQILEDLKSKNQISKECFEKISELIEIKKTNKAEVTDRIACIDKLIESLNTQDFKQDAKLMYLIEKQLCLDENKTQFDEFFLSILKVKFE